MVTELDRLGRQAAQRPTEQRVGPLPPGSYTVRAVTTDGREARRSVSLTGQDARKVRLRLK